MMYKVDWNDLSEICATDALTDIAREKSKGGKTLFITLNDVCDNVIDCAIVKYLAGAYPENIVYEELHETWGSGINAFVWGEKILGEGEDFDLHDIENTLDGWVIDEDTIIDSIEENTLTKEWVRFAEDHKLDVCDGKLYKAFKDYIYIDGSIGAFGADFNWDECYKSIVNI